MRKFGLVIVTFAVVSLGLLGFRVALTDPPTDTLPANMKPAGAIAEVPTDAEGNICVSVNQYRLSTDETFFIGSLKTSGIDFRSAPQQEKYAMAQALRNAIVARHNANLTQADAGVCHLSAGEAYADPPHCTDCSGGGNQCCGKWCPGLISYYGYFTRCTSFCGMNDCYNVTECCEPGCNTWCNQPCCPA